MTEQETLDTVVAHARKQQCKSISSGYCLYRGPNGTACFAGCLIPDSDYTDDMEDKTVRSDMISNYFTGRGFNIPLVRALQAVHDNFWVEEWEARFKQTAMRFGLIYKEPV